MISRWGSTQLAEDEIQLLQRQRERVAAGDDRVPDLRVDADVVDHRPD
jgi:hypothetical protein